MEKIEWNTQEYIHREKTIDWYWIVAIVTISIALIAVILNDVIFAILILISAFTLSIYSSRKPKIIDVQIDSFGILVGKTRHQYGGLESFWIETRDAFPRIILKSQNRFASYITILIENVPPEEIRFVLARHLPEIELSEPFLEKVLIYLGF